MEKNKVILELSKDQIIALYCLVSNDYMIHQSKLNRFKVNSIKDSIDKEMLEEKTKSLLDIASQLSQTEFIKNL